MKKLLFYQLLALATFFFLSLNCFCLSGKIIEINEIHPNPKGKDSGNEWLELKNNSENEINLSGWTILTKKSYKIANNTTIKPFSHLVIQDKKLVLKNTENLIQLLDAEKTLIDQIEYPKSIENMSFSKVEIKSYDNSKSFWTWTSPTKNSQNQIFYEFTGIISSEISQENAQRQSFEIFDSKTKQTLKIIFEGSSQEQKILKATLQKDSNVKLLTVKEKSAQNTFLLKEYQTEGNSAQPKEEEIKKAPQWKYFLVLPSAIISAFLICFLYKLFKES